jgi:hypothetical protein
LSEQPREGFRSVSKAPPPGALSRARAWLLEVAPEALTIFEDWASLARICETGWLVAARRPVGLPSSATDHIARRRLRVLTSRPLPFSAFAAARAGEGPLHLRGTCAALPGHPVEAPLWQIETRDDPAEGRLLVEEARDFLLSVADGDGATAGVVYVVAAGGHLVTPAPVRAGDVVSVFGFADEVPDVTGLAAAPHGRGGLLAAIRSGSELPLLLTHSRG